MREEHKRAENKKETRDTQEIEQKETDEEGMRCREALTLFCTP